MVILMIFVDTNLTVYSLMYKESKCSEISRLSHTVHEKKAIYCFYLNSA
jgi:hypothetical protein